MFLILTLNGQSDKAFLLTSKFCPQGVACPSPGLYTCGKKHKKYVENQSRKRFFLNLQQMVNVTRPFCWHQNFVPEGLSTLAPGLYTCGKTLKNIYKIRVERDFFLNLQQMVKVIRSFCWHQNFDPNMLSAPARGYIHVEKHEKNVYKIRLQRDCFKTQQMGKVIRAFCWHQHSSPRGCLPLPGAICMYKSIKIYTRTRCQVSIYRITGPLILCMSTSFSEFYNVYRYLQKWFLRQHRS